VCYILWYNAPTMLLATGRQHRGKNGWSRRVEILNTGMHKLAIPLHVQQVIHKFTCAVQSYEDLFIDTVSVICSNKGP
jgi:hypothetical protein